MQKAPAGVATGAVGTADATLVRVAGLSEGDLQCSLTVVTVSAVTADATGITGLHAKCDILPYSRFNTRLQVKRGAILRWREADIAACSRGTHAHLAV